MCACWSPLHLLFNGGSTCTMCMYGGQGTPLWSLFFPSSLTWVLRIELIFRFVQEASFPAEPVTGPALFTIYLNFFIRLVLFYVWEFCLHTCTFTMCTVGVFRRQERVTNSLELAFQMVLRHCSGIKFKLLLRLHCIFLVVATSSVKWWKDWQLYICGHFISVHAVGLSYTSNHRILPKGDTEANSLCI